MKSRYFELTSNDDAPNHQQCRVCHLRGLRSLVIATTVNLRMLRKHILSWNPHILEASVSVTGAIVPHLEANIARRDSRQRRPILQPPELHHEEMRTVVLPTNRESCSDNGMRARESRSPRPELRRRYCGGVDDELVCLLVICSRGLHATHEASVAKLRRHIGTDDLSSFGKREPLLLLTVRGLEMDRWFEHDCCHAEGASEMSVWGRLGSGPLCRAALTHLELMSTYRGPTCSKTRCLCLSMSSKVALPTSNPSSYKSSRFMFPYDGGSLLVSRDPIRVSTRSNAARRCSTFSWLIMCQ